MSGDNTDTARAAFALAPGERWYVVHTRPHREAGAAVQLANQGFRTFLPRQPRTRRHARRMETVLAPIFPRYLFVALDLGRDRWRAVNGTFGVERLVMAGDRPQPVPEGVVEALAVRADSHGVVCFEGESSLKPGAAVRVLAGPFADLVGRLERLDESGRVRILLDIMGQSVPVAVPLPAVVPAE